MSGAEEGVTSSSLRLADESGGRSNSTGGSRSRSPKSSKGAAGTGSSSTVPSPTSGGGSPGVEQRTSKTKRSGGGGGGGRSHINNNNNSNNGSSRMNRHTSHRSGGGGGGGGGGTGSKGRGSRPGGGGGGGLTLPIGGGTDLSTAFISSTSPTPSTTYDPHRKLYLTRAITFDQMDIQAALDQMRTVLSFTPHRVYKTSYYRKQTKNHWARDDPAFAVLEVSFLLVSSFAYCVAFKQSNVVLATLKFGLQNIGGVWLLGGIIMASIGRWLSNSYLTAHGTSGNGITEKPMAGGGTGGGGTNGGGGTSSVGGISSHHVRQGVEWLYAFDIHCNAFLPLFVTLYVVQFFLLPLVLGNTIMALIISNTLYTIGFSWYFYITHLGYRALPFLSNTEVFLLPIVVVVLIYILNFVGYPFNLGFNASRLMAQFYFA